MSNRMKDAEIDESGNISTKSSKNRTIEDTSNNSKSTRSLSLLISLSLSVSL